MTAVDGNLQHGRRRPALRSLLMPGVFEADAAAFEVGHVPRGQYGAAGTGDGGDLSVKLRNRTALRSACAGDLGEDASSFLIEGQNASGKDFAEHSVSARKQRQTALSVLQKFNAVENFGHAHRS